MPGRRLLVPTLALVILGLALAGAVVLPGEPPAAPPSGQAAAVHPAPRVIGPRVIAPRVIAPRLAALEQAFERRRVELAIPGMALAVVQGDDVILLKGFGLRDRERELPATPDTRFAIGSLTKAFTALLAVISQDEGKLSLDDPPRKHLPYFKLRDPAADAGVTLRDLLAHRVGLGSDDGGLWHATGLGREQVIRAGMSAPQMAPLRRAYHYNNVLYTAAGEAVARAQGATWERLIAERIFRPLQMRASDTSIAAMQRSADFALGYTVSRPRTWMPPVDLANVAPAGAIDSTARDMAQWLRLMLGRGTYGGRRLVSERGMDELFRKHTSMYEGADYCLGWGAKRWHGHETFGHRGAIDGFSAAISLMPDRGLGMVLLTNVMYSDLIAEAPGLVWEHLADEP